jgi:hypothetical protein
VIPVANYTEGQFKRAMGVEFMRRLGGVNPDLKRSICSQHPEFPNAACAGFRKPPVIKPLPGDGIMRSGPMAGCEAHPTLYGTYNCGGRWVTDY